MKEKNINILGALFLVLVIAVVPLLVSVKKYVIGLNSFSWFSGSEATYDFFLYWKGQALIFVCGIMALYVAVKLFIGKHYAFVKIDWMYLIPLLVYLGMSVLSTVFSENREMAFWGGYEQWEGMIIVGMYVMVFVMTTCCIKEKAEMWIVIYGLLAGVLAMAFLSTMQAFGHDFFRTPAGQEVLNFMGKEKMQFTFKFALGRVYATLYNPNYVGSYVALVLPIILSLICFCHKKVEVIRSVVAILTSVFLVIMLLGSQSVTGFLGMLASILLLVAILFTNMKEHPRISVGIMLGVLGLGVAIVFFNKPIFEYGYNKIVNPTQNNFEIKSMVSKDGILEIETVNANRLRLAVYIKDGSYVYEAADGENQPAGIYYDEAKKCMKFKDERFKNIEIYEKTVQSDGEMYNAFEVATPAAGKSYTIVMQTQQDDTEDNQQVYQMYNPFQRLDDIRNIESIGFEKNQHFASRRGYIWSRTMPLLGKHVILGSGPNTFVYEFPNDDYVGMKNVGYDGAIVTKPHNMFMQIWVQTGFISLLAFLALYGFYAIDCIRLYVRKTQYCQMERLGIGIFVGTFGYLVTGLANDSTVAVAPMYWCLLGIGVAVNRYNRLGGNSIEENITNSN